jgi:hypothetical protein
MKKENIALKKYVIVRFLDSCHKYPYQYGKYALAVGNMSLISVINDILGFHHPHLDDEFKKTAKGLLKYIDTKDMTCLNKVSEYNKNKLIALLQNS